MKKLCIAALLLLTLAACAAPTAVPATVATVDPFIALDSAQRTAEAAQDQAQTYSRQLTATAEAPIIALTSTAGAWQMQLAYAEATSQAVSATETAVMTQTAMSWTATPNATSTVVAAQAEAATTQIANETRLSDLAVERARTTNLIRAVSLYVIGFAVLVLALAWGIGLARKHSVYAIPTNENGDKSAILIDGIVMDVDRLPNGMGQMTKSYIAQLPGVSAERQELVTMRDQQIDLKARTKVTNAALEKFMKEHALNVPTPTATTLARIPETVVTEDDVNMPLPPWDFIKQWDGTAKPLGFGKAGLITAKAASPHILISGKTGSGKTIYMMRTLTAASLAKGSQVVNIGYSNAGYGVFEQHVNFHNVQLPDPRYVIECLAQVYDELKSRKTLIGGDMVEWEYWPGGQPPRPFLDVMLDELGNMAEDIYKDYVDGTKLTKELWSYISRIANEGRKVGIRFVAALQDPTSKSMDLRFRRNCTLVAFRQGDQDQSRAFLGTAGAEQLSVGHFMASLDSLVIGGGFSPTDAEILDYLAKSPVRPTEPPNWIEGVTQPRIDERSEPTPINVIEPTASESLPSAKPVDEIAEMAERIRAQWSPTMSARHVAMKLLGFPQNGGAYGIKTDKVIEYLIATTQTATTTQNQPEMGSFEAIPA